MMARVSDNIRKQLLKLSARNRRFMDSLVTLLWCECKEGNPTKSTSWEDWCDIELEWYGGGCGATVDREIPHGEKNYGSASDCYVCFNTPRRAMTKAQLDAVQEFIDTHTFRSITQAKMEIARDLLNDCCASALNIVYETFYAPAERKRQRAERDRVLAERRDCQLFPPESGCSDGADAYEGQH